MRFLCIDPRWDGGRAEPEYLREQGFEGVRFVAFLDRFDDVAYYINEGFKVQLVIAAESGIVEGFADWFRADDNPDLEAWFRSMVSWVVGNEPDATEGSSSWIMNPMEYWDLWQRAKCLHGERWVAGQCSGQVDRSRWYAQEDMTGIVVHPYGKTPAEAVALVEEYAATLQTSVWVGEFHPVEGYDASIYFDYFNAYGIWANFFCYSDQMVEGFGWPSAA